MKGDPGDGTIIVYGTLRSFAGKYRTYCTAPVKHVRSITYERSPAPTRHKSEYVGG
jgi:hypothetical protein